MGQFIDFIDAYWYAIILVLIICSLLFIILGHEYRDQIQSVLKKTFVNLPADTIDWWSISHFVIYAIFGFVKPGYPLTAFTFGAAFELFEDYMSSDAGTQLADCVNEPFNPDGSRRLWCNGRQDDYWYAKHSDVFWNLFGYVTGQAIRGSVAPVAV